MGRRWGWLQAGAARITEAPNDCSSCGLGLTRAGRDDGRSAHGSTTPAVWLSVCNTLLDRFLCRCCAGWRPRRALQLGPHLGGLSTHGLCRRYFDPDEVGDELVSR